MHVTRQLLPSCCRYRTTVVWGCQKITDIMTEKGTVETVIQEAGGCGRYQVRLSLLIHSMKIYPCFSIIAMVFGSAVPDWWCVDDTGYGNLTTFNSSGNGTLYKSCTTASGDVCKQFSFSDDFRSLVTEWDLVCGMDWVPAFTVSIQFGGLLVGNLFSGYVADAIGRKPPLYICIGILVIFNLMAALSVNWIMFSMARFVIGVGVAFHITVQYNIQSEFAVARWRSVLVAFPSWPISASLFSLVAYLCKDWRQIHYVTSGIALLNLLTWWFVPESFRWYMAHDRAKEAQKVITKVARFNGHPEPSIELLQKLAQSEAESTKSFERYTLLDLFKSAHLRRVTLLLIIDWITLGLVTYGITFGIAKLSGSLYINIFLFGIVLSPISCVCMYSNNRFGRQRTSVVAFILTSSSSVIVGIIQLLDIDANLQGQLTNAFSILAYAGICLAWPGMQTLTLEIYPTVVRNIGYGFQNMWARVGAIIGPQLIFLDARVPGLMYFTCAIISFLCVVATALLPETKDRNLEDKISDIDVTLRNTSGVFSTDKDPTEDETIQ